MFHDELWQYTFLDDPSTEFLDALLGFRDCVLHMNPSTIRSLIDSLHDRYFKSV